MKIVRFFGEYQPIKPNYMQVYMQIPISSI